MSMKVTELFPIRPLQSRTDALLENEVLIVLLNMAGKESIIAIRNTQPVQVLRYYLAREVNDDWSNYRFVPMLNNKILGDWELMSDLASRLKKTAQEINYLIKEPIGWDMK